jgi:CRP-like cAMP-binding protein
MTLSTIEKVLFLRAAELFSDVETEELVPIAHIAEEITISAGERFITQGDIGDCLYIIVDGEASILLAGAGELARRGPKSVIGEMAVISRNPRSAHCIALTDITALKVTHDDFWELMDQYPRLARGTIQVLARRLDEAVANLRRVASAGSVESVTV